MLNTQWKREEDIEREMERQRNVLNRERNLQLLHHNDAEKGLREDQLKTEKDRDREMLSKAINKEQEIERLEREELARRRQEVIDLQKFYMQKAEDKKAEEQLIEYLTWIDSEKQWKHREDKWQKEDEARINLMRQVYDHRARTIGAKQQIAGEDKWKVQYEKNVLDEENQRMQAEAEEKLVRDQLYKKNN